MAGGIKPIIEQSIAILAGFVGAKWAVNAVNLDMTGYVRGAAQIAVGLIGGEMAKKALPAKMRHMAPSLAAGAAAAGILTIIDEITKNKYRSFYNLSGAGNETYYIPSGGMGRYLSAGPGHFGDYSAIGEDGYSSQAPAMGRSFKPAF